jgi:hypothetical protein
MYEQRLETSSQSDHCKALYLLQRNVERSVLSSEDDIEASEPERLSQLTAGGASTSKGTPVTPSLDGSSSTEQKEWEDLLEAGTWMKEVPGWVMAEELYQSTAISTSLACKPLTGSALDWWK